MARTRRNPSKKAWLMIAGASVGAAALMIAFWPASAAAAGTGTGTGTGGSGLTGDAARAAWLADTMEGRVANPLYTRKDGSVSRVTAAEAQQLVASKTAFWESAYHGSIKEGKPVYSKGTVFDTEGNPVGIRLTR